MITKIVDKTIQVDIAIAKNAEMLIKKLCFDTEAKAKANAPVRTGNLKNSIHSEVNNLEGEVIAGADYAYFVEYGSKGRVAKPFLTPAVDDTLAEFNTFVEDLKV